MIAVGTEGGGALAEWAEDVLYLPRCGRLAHLILEVVPLQFLAYHMAEFDGTHVDQYRNLA